MSQPVAFATISLGLGENERALDEIKRALEGRRGWLAYLKVNPNVDPLRGHRGFEDLLRRLRLQLARFRTSLRDAGTSLCRKRATMPIVARSGGTLASQAPRRHSGRNRAGYPGWRAPGRSPLLPTDRELDAMAVVLEIGSGTVADVRRAIMQREESEPAYTTILTFLRSLRAKGWLMSTRSGRADRYAPVADAHTPTLPWFAAAMQRSLRLYGSDEVLLLDLAERGRLTRQAMRLACRALERRAEGRR